MDNVEKLETAYSYKISDIAELLQISRAHAYYLVRHRKIPGGYRLGDLWRVRGKIFREYIEKLGEQPNYRIDEPCHDTDGQMELNNQKQAAAG